MRRVAWLAGLMMLAGANVASAQLGSVVLLPTRGDDRLAAQRETAQRALIEALGTHGFNVVTHADALAHLPEGSVACGAVDCAPNMLRALSMQAAAACAVWLSPDAPEGTVFVTLVDDTGARYPGARPVHGGDLAIATRAALADARSLQMLGPGPWVQVRGKPQGARVIIDGEVVGTLPYRSAMTAGRYALRVQAPGHISEIQDLDIPLNAGRVVEVEVELVPGEDPIAPPTTEITAPQHAMHAPLKRATQKSASTGDYVLGGAIALGGLLLMTIDPVWTLAKDGECADAQCRRIYGLSTRSALEILGGAALIGIGAVVTFVVQPFAVEVRGGEQSTLVLKANF